MKQFSGNLAANKIHIYCYENKFFYGLILILTSLLLGAEPAESSLPRPKLVVGIVVDQMRWDYLYRYYDRYGDRGFKRLLKEGFTCENTQLNYLPAFTAVGHTCFTPVLFPR